MILKEELAACARSKRSLAQHLEATKQSMLAIIGQYKEELNQSVAHEQKLVEDFAQVYAEKEARGRVIDALYQEATMWMDSFALTLNGSQDLPRLLAKAKAMAEQGAELSQAMVRSRDELTAEVNQEEGVRDMRSWVRGQWIPFDADALSQFLGYPLVLEEGQECEYGQRRNRFDGFDEEAIAQLLCIPGQDFARTAAGRRVRIMRTNMTTLTQIWMTLLLSNIQPSDHNSNLPLPKCQLVYAILTRMSIHVAQLIVDAIYLFVGMAPTRHPLDSNKSNRALGFPALITGLCQSFGVPVAPSKVIRLPITRAVIEKYCTQRQAQGDAPQAVDVPPPHQAGPAGSFDIEQYLRHLVRQQAANHRAHVQTHDCLYQLSLSLKSQGFTSFPCPTPDQFRAEVAWPGDWPEARAGEAPAEAPAEAPDEADEAREDEEMTDLLDFLGGSGAT
ncbi:hypothetical protein HKD37_19G053458 [Glycine soja]